MKKDKLFIVANILTIVVIMASIFSIVSLGDYLNGLEIKWDNYTYQIFLQVVVSMLFSVILFVVVYFIYHTRLSNKSKEVIELTKENHNKNEAIETLNKKLANNRLYDFSLKVWGLELLSEYIKQIYEKKMGIFSCLTIKCDSKEIENTFLTGMRMLNDPKVVVFKKSNLEYVILCINLSKEDIISNSNFIKTSKVNIISSNTFNTNFDEEKDVLDTMEVNHE